MDLENLCVQVWENLGKPSDTSPYSGGVFDVTEAATIIRWVNQGYRRVCGYRFPNGEPVFFQALNKSLYFKRIKITGDVTDATSSTVTLDSGDVGAVRATADAYNGWVIEITDGTGEGQVRLITDFTAARVASVSEDWSTTPDSTSDYALMKNDYSFVASGAADEDENIVVDPVNSILSVTKVLDVSDMSTIVPLLRTDSLVSSLKSPGNPKAYMWYAGGIVFDVPIDDERWFKIEYVETPAELSAGSDEPVIPSIYHDGIMLWATHLGLIRYQESGEAYARKRDFYDFMRMVKMERDHEFDREDSWLEPGV